MKRRIALGAMAAGGWMVLQTPALAQVAADLPLFLRKGGCVVILRHAQTAPGLGDPPNFRIDQCSTQRNLSEKGRAQARHIGQWFTTHDLQARAVYSSAWCRCKETADLAFSRHTVLPLLNSTFNDRTNQPDATKELSVRLAAVPTGQFEVWVTHQVNILSLTGEDPAMGEAFIVHSDGKIRTRTYFG